MENREEKYSLDACDDTEFKSSIDFIPDPQKWAVINKKIFPEQRWRIKNLIPYEGFTILAGISGECKTWIAMEMAKSIACGVDFLGHEGFPSMQANVLYLDMEMSQQEFQRRGRQLSFEIAEENLFVTNNCDFNLNDDLKIMELKSIIKHFNISVVFIDTFRAVAGGLREEKAEEVRKFLQQFKSFKDEGVSLVFLDHYRKPNNFEGKIPKKEHLFGSVDKVASIEILLMVKTDESDNSVNIYQRKNRLDKELDPFKIYLKDEIDQDQQKKTKLSFGGFISTDENKKDQAKAVIPFLLTDTGLTRKEILKGLLDEGIGEKNASDALRELDKAGIIEVNKKGRENYYLLPKNEELKERDKQS